MQTIKNITVLRNINLKVFNDFVIYLVFLGFDKTCKYMSVVRIIFYGCM